MQQREVEIVNKLGLHARASAKLTQLAGKYESEVWMSRSGCSRWHETIAAGGPGTLWRMCGICGLYSPSEHPPAAILRL